MSRTLKIGIKRFDLSGVEGWDGCYLDYRPMTMGDLMKLQSLQDGVSEAESIAFMLNHVSSHVIGGKVIATDADEPQDLQDGDLDMLPVETITSLFADMSGASTDPKDIQTEASDKPAPSSESAASEMSSSEA